MAANLSPSRVAVHANTGSGRQTAHSGQGSQNVNESSGNFLNHPVYVSNDEYNIYCRLFSPCPLPTNTYIHNLTIDGCLTGCFCWCPFRRSIKHGRRGRNDVIQCTTPVARFRSLGLVSRRTQTGITTSTFSASATVYSSPPSTEVAISRVPSAQSKPSILGFLKAWLPDLDKRDADGCTALHDAVKRGLTLVVRHSLENDTLPLGLGLRIPINLAHLLNVKDKQGRTPIHHAAIHDNITLLRLLTEKGGSLAIKDKRGRTVLHIAAKQGQLSAVRHLLQKEKWGRETVLNLLKARNLKGLTALHLAAIKGHDEVVRALLTCEAELMDAAQEVSMRPRMVEEMEAFFSQTPLHLAVRMMHIETVRALVDGHNGAGEPIATGNLAGNEHINILDYQGRTALHLACVIPTQVPTHRNSDDEVRRVAADMVAILVGAGAAVNVRDTFGCTPLMYAAQRANIRAVKCLIQRGADVAVRDGRLGGNGLVGNGSRRAEGRSALDYAEDDAPRGTERDEVMRILDLCLVGRRSTF